MNEEEQDNLQKFPASEGPSHEPQPKPNEEILSRPMPPKSELIDPDEIGRPVLRDEAGRFLKGTRAGPGHPLSRIKGQKIRNAMYKRLTKGNVDEMVQTLIDRATQGDMKALNIIFQYTIGKPVQSIDMNVTAAQITPEEADERIRKFFGMS